MAYILISGRGGTMLESRDTARMSRFAKYFFDLIS